MKRRGPQPRKDDNHNEISRALGKIGCTILDLSAVGNGCPDILVGTAGRNILMEIKDGAKPPSARKLTPQEDSFHSTWGGTVYTVCTVQEAIDIISNTDRQRWNTGHK